MSHKKAKKSRKKVKAIVAQLQSLSQGYRAGAISLEDAETALKHLGDNADPTISDSTPTQPITQSP